MCSIKSSSFNNNLKGFEHNLRKNIRTRNIIGKLKYLTTISEENENINNKINTIVYKHSLFPVFAFINFPWNNVLIYKNLY